MEFPKVKLILKSNKPPTTPSTYRPKILLPLFSKMFEKLLLKRFLPILVERDTIPNHQFGFRSCHFTTHQSGGFKFVVSAMLVIHICGFWTKLLNAKTTSKVRPRPKKMYSYLTWDPLNIARECKYLT